MSVCITLPSGEPLLASLQQPPPPMLAPSIADAIAMQAVAAEPHDETRWRHVAERLRTHQSQPLSIAVIGVSVTAGCGSEEPWEGWESPGSAPKDNSAKCSLPSSWTRRLTDELRMGLPLPTERCDGRRTDEEASAAYDLPVDAKACSVRTSVAFKNAVSADYFATCTASYLPSNATADLILLEAATNDWGSRRGMGRLLSALRREAPLAPIVFVGWTRRRMPSMPEVIASAAREYGAEIVDIAQVVERLHKTNVLLDGQPRSAPWSRFKPKQMQTAYAQGGLDQVHPSPVGHAVVAAVTTRHVLTRLRTALCPGSQRAIWSDTNGKKSASTVNHGGGSRGSHVGEEDMEGFDEVIASWEKCWTALEPGRYPVATTEAAVAAESAGVTDPPDELRTNEHGPDADEPTWMRVDDGAAKGVPKLGLASWKVGERVRLGPIRGPPGVGAAALVAELGYFISTRPGQGAFRIDCFGCNCTAVRASRSYHAPRCLSRHGHCTAVIPLLLPSSATKP